MPYLVSTLNYAEKKNSVLFFYRPRIEKSKKSPNYNPIKADKATKKAQEISR
ncbi:hypothetical protein AsAng_0046570 [Aureispira anguillae]|uniref:Uncharacterized protein n=1 Tax=Aureispira anguillae TaxID=2864201 RepID=A0A915YJ06_9BACT|nr:hypothetical protein AsAng_0046570 [Aureispira anguillae]